MAVFSDALVMQIRGDSSHLFAELERSRLALAVLRRDFERFQQEQAAAVNRSFALTNSRSASARGGFVSSALPARAPLFSERGPVRGPTGIDRVPALLSAGEFVVSRPAVERLGVRFMEQINAQRFQDGGLARSPSSLLPGPAYTFGPFPTTQEGRLRFLGIDALPRFLDQALRLFDLGRRTGDPSFLRLGLPIQQVLANFRLLLSDRNRQSVRGALEPLDTELRRRPDAQRAVLGLIAAPELRLELLRLLGVEDPERTLAGFLQRSQSPLQGSGTEGDPFAIAPVSDASSASGASRGSPPSPIPAPTTTNQFGGVHINVRNATDVGDVIRQLQRRGVTGRLRRGG